MIPTEACFHKFKFSSQEESCTPSPYFQLDSSGVPSATSQRSPKEHHEILGQRMGRTRAQTVEVQMSHGRNS